jgi:hypothetical protein
MRAADTLSLPGDYASLLEDGIACFGSILWSRMIVFLYENLVGPQSFVLSVATWVLFIRGSFRVVGKAAKVVFSIQMWFLIVLWHLRAEHISWLVDNVLFPAVAVLSKWQHNDWAVFLEWLQWRLTSVVTSFAVLMHSLNSEVARYHSESLASGRRTLVAHFKQFTMSSATFISDLSLPSFVRNRFSMNPTIDNLKASMELMKSLGWPINVDLDDPVPVEGLSPATFKEWVLCGSSFKQGIHNSKVFVDHDLMFLRGAEEYRRTEEYASTKNELVATSRYFVRPEYKFPDIPLEEVWLVLGDIFRNSRLTPFNYIIGKWEKRYALGAFMVDPVNHLRKLSRKKFISSVGGYGPFKALWAETFYWATQILPVSAVSVKGEALPARKWANDKVRSIVGSPITQYILSTIWNYGPNHRFAWESTPIKIGMPLNGYWMGTIWARHARCQLHIEGDFQSFDSTVSGPVIDVIKGIRKMGFQFHKDRERIAELIDINYEQVINQLLNTTSTGNIYKKGTGLTTGHSSTSMDNSVALVVLYLMAWKDLTGLSSKEFLHFNELSCFGDDHVLSILATRPAVWTPKNIRATMARWGLVNNLEVKKSLDDVTFLSKHGRKATQAEIREVAKHGLTGVRFFVWHDKDKLVGKLTAKVRNLTPSYRLKRLTSYLALTAHHPDVYDGITKVIRSSKSLMAMVKNNKVVIPSYGKVLKDWYSPSSGPITSTEFDEEVVEALSSDRLVEYGATTFFDSILGAMSMVPDLLSPLLFNYGYNRAFQLFLKTRLCWVVDLVSLTNKSSTTGTLVGFLRRTPYRWLEASYHVPGGSHCNVSSLLVRHWLFLLYIHLRPSVKLAGALNLITTRLASAQFLINGKLFFDTRNSEFQLDMVLVAALLDSVSVPDWFPFLASLSLPDVQLLVDLASHFFLVTIWASVPPNFREVTASLRSLDPQRGPLAISAPTGTGKSTSFVQHVTNILGHKYRKIIVIEPRVALVVGLTAYMESSFGLSVSGSTTGLDLDKSKKVFYMTPQSLLGHVDLLTQENLFILDEAHLNEDFYILLRRVLSRLVLPRIFVSATMPETLVNSADKLIEIPIAQLWTVTTLQDTLNCRNMPPDAVLQAVVSAAVDAANSLPPGEKGLFFLPRRADVERASEMCTRSSTFVHGGVGVPDVWQDNIVFSTSICDVGITIPGVTYVWTSSILEVSKSKSFTRITDTAIGQRKGRTGRTNNGVFKLVTVQTEYSGSGRSTALSESDLVQMISSGLPPELAMMYDRDKTFAALGFDSSAFTDSQLQDATRGLSVFFRNFQPVFRGFIAASQSGSLPFGKPVVLHHTGIGNISSSFPQPGSGVEDHIVSLASSVVRAGLFGGSIPADDPSMLALSNIAGPVLGIKNLVAALVSDLAEGTTDFLNPKNSEVPGLVNDVFEVGRIMALLQSLPRDVK